MVAPEREVALALLDPLVLVVLMATLDLPDPPSVSASLSFQISRHYYSKPFKGETDVASYRVQSVLLDHQDSLVAPDPR